MELMTSEKLISLWQADGNWLVKPHSLPDTQSILDAIFCQMEASEIELTYNEVKQLIKGLYEHRKSIQQPITHKQARQRVNRLMELMNTLPNVSAVLVPEPVLAHRPTALPNSQNSFSAATQMADLDRQLLSWCRKKESLEAWTLVLAIRLMTRLGMSERVMLGTLSQLTPQHINKKIRSINIPSSPETLDHDGGHYRMVFTDDLWIPLRAVLTQGKSRPDNAWIFSDNEELEEKYSREDDDEEKDKALTQLIKKRRESLRKQLVRTYRVMLNDLKQSGKLSYCHLTTWPKINKASQYIPVLRGTPPLWSTLLRDYPLPTCTPIPLHFGQADAHHYAPGNRLGRLPDRKIKLIDIDRDKHISSHNSSVVTRPSGVQTIATDHLPNDWPRQVKNILQQFLSSTSRLSKNKVHANKYDKLMQERLEYYEKRICMFLGVSGHYPLWILHFLYYQLRTERNALSTAKTYLSRLTPITMLYHDAILDMSDWDDETILELEMSAKAGSRWSESTLASFQGAFRSFVRFCQQYGILEDVTLPRRLNSLTPTVLRTRIISPDHMHTLWEELTKGQPDGSSFQMKALVIALGFYGGLRASEVEALTLNDIQFGLKNEHGHMRCWVDILGGKTAAARRRIALHVMTPPSVITQLQGWVNIRRDECRKDALNHIALFGPRNSPDTYERRYLITLVIDEMRNLLGEDIDFHGLRHAAVSWTLLRVYAAQNPGFADTLQHRHHWMFQPEPLQDTLEFFCGAEGVDTIERGTVLLHVAKWVGHRDPETLLKNYAHTLGIIHGDILAPPRR